MSGETPIPPSQAIGNLALTATAGKGKSEKTTRNERGTRLSGLSQKASASIAGSTIESYYNQDVVLREEGHTTSDSRRESSSVETALASGEEDIISPKHMIRYFTSSDKVGRDGSGFEVAGLRDNLSESAADASIGVDISVNTAVLETALELASIEDTINFISERLEGSGCNISKADVAVTLLKHLIDRADYDLDRVSDLVDTVRRHRLWSDSYASESEFDNDPSFSRIASYYNVSKEIQAEKDGYIRSIEANWQEPFRTNTWEKSLWKHNLGKVPLRNLKRISSILTRRELEKIHPIWSAQQNKQTGLGIGHQFIKWLFDDIMRTMRTLNLPSRGRRQLEPNDLKALKAAYESDSDGNESSTDSFMGKVFTIEEADDAPHSTTNIQANPSTSTVLHGEAVQHMQSQPSRRQSHDTATGQSERLTLRPKSDIPDTAVRRSSRKRVRQSIEMISSVDIKRVKLGSPKHSSEEAHGTSGVSSQNSSYHESSEEESADERVIESRKQQTEFCDTCTKTAHQWSDHYADSISSNDLTLEQVVDVLSEGHRVGFNRMCHNCIRLTCGALGFLNNETGSKMRDILNKAHANRDRFPEFCAENLELFRGNNLSHQKFSPRVPTLPVWDRAEIFCRYSRNKEAFNKFLEEGTVNIAGIFDYLLNDTELKIIFDLEHNLYIHHSRTTDDKGWIRTKWYSLLQQALRLDPVHYALCAAVREDKRTSLIYYPYYGKDTFELGTNNYFAHWDINVQEFLEDGKCRYVVQGSFSYDEEDNNNCTLVVKGMHKHLREVWDSIPANHKKSNGPTTDGKLLWTKELQEKFGKLEPVPCKKGELRFTRGELLHGSTAKSSIRRRTLFCWPMAIDPNHTMLENPGSDTWEHLASSYNMMVPPQRSTSGAGLNFGGPSHRYPFENHLEPVLQGTSAFIGRLPYTNRQVVELQTVLFGSNADAAWQLINKHRQGIKKNIQQQWENVKLDEKYSYGERSFFWRLENNVTHPLDGDCIFRNKMFKPVDIRAQTYKSHKRKEVYVPNPVTNQTGVYHPEAAPSMSEHESVQTDLKWGAPSYIVYPGPQARPNCMIYESFSNYIRGEVEPFWTTWLDDSLVDFFMIQACKTDTGQTHVLPISSALYRHKEDRTGNTRVAKDTKWEYLLIPECAGSHWILHIFSRTKQVCLTLNTLDGVKLKSECNLIIRNMLGKPRVTYDNVHDVPQQSNTNDCGAMIAMMAETICSNPANLDMLFETRSVNSIAGWNRKLFTESKCRLWRMKWYEAIMAMSHDKNLWPDLRASQDSDSSIVEL